MSHPPSYQAIGFHESLPGGKTSGVLMLSRDRLTFRHDGGDVVFPGMGVRLRLGGASDRLVFVEHPRVHGWSVYTSDHQMLSDPLLTGLPDIEAQLKGVKGRKSWLRAQFGCLLLGVVLLIGGLYLAKPWMVDRVSDQVPVSWERELGDLAFEQYKLTAHFVEDGELAGLLTEFTALLTEHVDDKRYSYSFYVVRDPNINAFALPGGNVVIHSQALLAAESGEELLGVLAHEIAHVNRRHSIKRLVNSLGLALTVSALVGDIGTLGALTHQAARLLDERAFSRDNERDADQTGLSYLQAARINPQGLVTFFQKLQEEQADNAVSQAIDTGLNFLSTHPGTEARIADIQARIDQLPETDYRSTAERFNPLKERLAALLAVPSHTSDGDHENDP